MKSIFVLLFFSLFLLLSLSVFAQNPASGQLKTISSKEFSFDYPADWRLVDKSSENVQQFNLMPPSGNVLIMIITYPAEVQTYDNFNQVRTLTLQSLADRIYSNFNAAGNARKNDVCTTTNGVDIPGERITGIYGKEQSTADMYYFAMNNKFFSFMYLREDKELSKSDAVWNNIVRSFSVKDFNPDKPELIIDSGNDLVLNLRATKLVRPFVPSDRKFSGKVVVRVILDETGKVISSKAVSGITPLFPFAENAAKDSKFKPALVCGKLSKINGYIDYYFNYRR